MAAAAAACMDGIGVNSPWLGRGGAGSGRRRRIISMYLTISTFPSSVSLPACLSAEQVGQERERKPQLALIEAKTTGDDLIGTFYLSLRLFFLSFSK